MKLISFLLRTNGRGAVVVALTGIISGLASTVFVYLVNKALHQSDSSLLIVGFIVVAVARIAANVFAQWFVVRFSQQAVLELCEQLCDRVLETPFRTLERIGPSRIMTALTDDVTTLSGALQAITSVITNAAVLLGCVVYLAWLSWTAALALGALGLLGGFGYKLLTRKAMQPIAEARAEREALFRHFRTLTDGIKELKMNRARRHEFQHSDFTQTTQRLRRLNMSAMYHYLTADAWAQVMFFLIMGVMVFGLPRLNHISIESLTGYAFVALYAMTPIWGFIGALPIFHRGEAALTRIEDLGLALSTANTPENTESVLPSSTTSSGAAIELNDVVFEYGQTANGSGNFVLGPVSLAVHPGELVFLIGGNGSGKSTFVKLLTGLYSPDSGDVKINGQLVGPGSRERYREHFAAVFSDFFLFDNLAGLGGSDRDQQAQSYLKLLGLDHKVRVDNGVLSTTALSQGQRRRLALLAAYLEDRPVYVFDEWAADQDPTYRQIFYAKFLPELKARGKAVVVITHDDRYFHLGDRVIKLEYGKIVDTSRPADMFPDVPMANIELIPR